MFIENHLVYKEIFEQKIKDKNKVLLTSNNSKIIIENIDLINSLNMTVHFNENNINKNFYDVIIIDNINNYSDVELENLLEELKSKIKLSGFFMFLLPKYTLNDYFKYIKYITYFSGIDIENIYPSEPSDFHFKFLDNGIKIIDNYRIYSYSNFVLSNDFFIITCKLI